VQVGFLEEFNCFYLVNVTSTLNNLPATSYRRQIFFPFGRDAICDLSLHRMPEASDCSNVLAFFEGGST